MRKIMAWILAVTLVVSAQDISVLAGQKKATREIKYTGKIVEGMLTTYERENCEEAKANCSSNSMFADLYASNDVIAKQYGTQTGTLADDYGLQAGNYSGMPVISNYAQLIEQFPGSVNGTTRTITIDRDFYIAGEITFAIEKSGDTTIDHYILLPKGERTIHFLYEKNGEACYSKFFVQRGAYLSFGIASMGEENRLTLDGGGNIQYVDEKFVNQGTDGKAGCLRNYGSVEIYDGVVIQNFCTISECLISNVGNMKLNGGIITRNWIDKNDGANTGTSGYYAIISNVNDFEEGYAVASLEINDVKIYDNLTAAAYIGNHYGNVKMSGGEIVSAVSDEFKKWYDKRAFDCGFDLNGGTFTMMGGKIEGFWDNLYAFSASEESPSVINVEGGSICGYSYEGDPLFTSTDSAFKLMQHSKLTMSGGTITHVMRGISEADKCSVEMKGGIIYNNRGESGIVLHDNCTLTFSGGTIKGSMLGIHCYLYKCQNASIEMKEDAVIEHCVMNGIFIMPSCSLRMDGGMINACGSEEAFGTNLGMMLNGGGIYNGGDCIINGGIIQNCLAQNGGGIYNAGILYEGGQGEGNLTINDGIVRGNTADISGGGICNEGKTFTMNGGTIQNNLSYAGGGVSNGNHVYYASDAVMVMNGGTICNNGASELAGGLLNATTAYLNNGSIERNKAPSCAGIADGNGKTIMSKSFIIRDNVNTHDVTPEDDEKPVLGMKEVTINLAKDMSADIDILENPDNKIEEIRPFVIVNGKYQQLTDMKIERVTRGSYRLTVTNPSIVNANKTIKKTIYLDVITNTRHYQKDKDLILKLTLKKQSPKVSIRQAQKLNLFYTDGTAKFTLKADKGEITGVTVNAAEGDHFNCLYDAETNTGTIVQKGNMPLKADGTVNIGKLDKTVDLIVSFADYQPVAVTLKAAVVSKTPSMSFLPGNIVIYPEWGNYYSDVSLYNKTEKCTDSVSEYTSIISKTEGVAVLDNKDGTLRIEYDGKKGKRVKVELLRSNWRKALSVSMNVKVGVPKAGMSVKTVMLNSNQIGEALPYTVTMNLIENTGLKLSTPQVTGSNKAARTALDQGSLQVKAKEDGSIVLELHETEGRLPKNGNYPLKIVPYVETVEGLQPLKAVSLTVKVTDKKPSVSFSGKGKISLSKPEQVSLSTYQTKVQYLTADVTDVNIVTDTAQKFAVNYLGAGKFYIFSNNVSSLKAGQKYTVPLEVTFSNGTKIQKDVTVSVIK